MLKIFKRIYPKARILTTFHLNNFQFSTEIDEMHREKKQVRQAKYQFINSDILKNSSRTKLIESIDNAISLIKNRNDNDNLAYIWDNLIELTPQIQNKKKDFIFDNKNLLELIDCSLDGLRTNPNLINLRGFLEFMVAFQIDNKEIVEEVVNLIPASNLKREDALLLYHEFKLPYEPNLDDFKVNQLNVREKILLMNILSFSNYDEPIILTHLDEIVQSLKKDFKNRKDLGFIFDLLPALLEGLINVRLSLTNNEEDMINFTASQINNFFKEIDINKKAELYSFLQQQAYWSPNIEEIFLNCFDELRNSILEINYKYLDNLISFFLNDEEFGKQEIIKQKNEVLVENILSNILLSKNHIIYMGKKLITTLLDLCDHYGFWTHELEKNFSNSIVALYEVKRIDYLSLGTAMTKVFKINGNKLPESLVSMIKIYSNELFNSIYISDALIIYSGLKDLGKEREQYFQIIQNRVENHLNESKQNINILFSNELFEFIIQNVAVLEKKLTERYTELFTKNIHLIPNKSLLRLLTVLGINYNLILAKMLMINKFVALIQNDIRKRYPSFDDKEKISYIKNQKLFVNKLKKIMEKSKKIEIVETEDFLAAPNVSHKFFIPMNIALFQTEFNQAQSNRGIPSALLADISYILGNARNDSTSYQKILEDLIINIKVRKVSLEEFINIMRTSDAIRAEFERRYLKDDPNFAELLIEILEKDLTSIENNKIHNYLNIFVMINFLQYWKIDIYQIKNTIIKFINKSVDNFGIDEVLAMLSLGNSVLKAEKEQIYNVGINKLASLMIDQELSANQAYSLIMALPPSKIEEKTFSEIERIISNNIAVYKIQDIVKLLEKLNRNNILSSKILWNIKKTYLKEEHCQSMNPKQFSILVKIFLRAEESDISKYTLDYFKKNNMAINEIETLKLLTNENLVTQSSLMSNYAELVNNTTNIILQKGNLAHLVAILGSREILNLDNSQLKDKIMDVSSQFEADNFDSAKQLSEILHLVQRNAPSLQSTLDVIARDLLKSFVYKFHLNIEKNQNLFIQIISNLCDYPKVLQAYKDQIKQIIPLFLNSIDDNLIISKFVLAYFRTFETLKDENSEKIRKKLLRINNHSLIGFETIRNLLDLILLFSQNQDDNSFYSLKDYGILNKIENIIILKSSHLSDFEFGEIYKFYIENNLGSNKILEFFEKKLYYQYSQ